MKAFVLAVLLCAVFDSVLLAQADPSRAVNDAMMSSRMERARGQQVPMQDQQGIATPKGRNLDVQAIAKKTKELDEVVHSVNLDVINMGKGVLAADISEKLKKIEKLSKELRHAIE